VENDLRVMKIKRWRKKAQNREEWASVIKEAKVLKDRRAKEQANNFVSFKTSGTFNYKPSCFASGTQWKTQFSSIVTSLS
jgi:hypothetical protein